MVAENTKGAAMKAKIISMPKGRKSHRDARKSSPTLDKPEVERSDCPIHGKGMMYLTYETPAAKYYRCQKCNLLKSVDKVTRR